MDNTGSPLPGQVASSRPDGSFQRLIEPSPPPVKANLPSGATAMAMTPSWHSSCAGVQVLPPPGLSRQTRGSQEQRVPVVRSLSI